MTDDSGEKPKELEPKEFEFDASDIPGLNLAPESPVQEAEPPVNASTDAPLEAEAPLEPATPVTSDPSAALQADTIQKVKEFSENMPMEKIEVPSAFPFSLLIEGALTPEEKEKLLDVLSREAMGIREVDLEPQFESHRILIPRISEYAGILLVQALRGTRARMRLGPSDSIFSAHDAESVSDPFQPGMSLPETDAGMTLSPDYGHSAEQIAITPDSSLPQLPRFDVIDTLLASAVLNSNLVEAEKSSEYAEIFENLKRELKYKAYRKGAVGIIHFKTELQQLSLATQYRLTVSGAAIRPHTGETQVDPEILPEITH